MNAQVTSDVRGKRSRRAFPILAGPIRRFVFLLFGILLFTWLEFEFFPGHSYLQSGTQLYVPMLEHLDSPGYLSRDLVATHPVLTHTIYDEVTLFLHEAARVDLKKALVAQQLLCRAAGICGVFLLAASSGVPDLLSFVIAAFVNMGALLIGPSVRLTELEPVPAAFAFPLVLLAAGLLSREKPLLAGLAGGIAFVYEPALAAPFWVVVLLALILDRKVRPLFRPALLILIVFVLLLANLAQLQPGVLESQPLWAKISDSMVQLQRFRTGYLWVSLWAPSGIWNYLAICICGLWATARIWGALNRQARWLFVALPLCGIFSVPLSALLLEQFRLFIATELQPARTLLYTVACSSVACGVAGARAIIAQKRGEASLWFLLVIALPVQAHIFDLLRWNELRNFLELGAAILLATALVLLWSSFGASPRRGAIIAIPLATVFMMAAIARREPAQNLHGKAIAELASWAEESTWGSSTFLFPDAGQQAYPGAFRALSKRAVWVDWKSGELVARFNSFAPIWRDRWRQTMGNGASATRLDGVLRLPIDYYVVKREHSLARVRPVFANSEFVVYDARDLRNAALSLH